MAQQAKKTLETEASPWFLQSSSYVSFLQLQPLYKQTQNAWLIPWFWSTLWQRHCYNSNSHNLVISGQMLTTRSQRRVHVSKEGQRLPFQAENRRSIWVLPFCLSLSERLSGGIREKQECIWRLPQAHPTAPQHGDVPQCSAVFQPARKMSENPDVPDSCGHVCTHPEHTKIYVDFRAGCGHVGERTIMLPRQVSPTSRQGSSGRWLGHGETQLRKCSLGHS